MMEDNARPFQYNASIVKEFIETYECLPELWDSKHPQYLNKNNRNAALGVLLKVLQKANSEATKGDVRKKINTLRSNYRRELKKIYLSRSTANNDDDVYQPSSWTFYSLTFLDSGDSDKDVTTTTIAMADNEEVIEEIELTSHNCNLKTESEEIYVSEEVTLQPTNSTIEYIEEEYLEPEPEPLPPPPKKHKVSLSENLLVKNNEILKRVCAHLARSEELSQSTVWCRKLEKLDATQRFYAEKAINDILFEAALGKLDKSSVLINGYIHENSDST